jgi:hypothetical protein
MLTKGVLPLLVAIALPFLPPTLAMAFTMQELLSDLVHMLFGKGGMSCFSSRQDKTKRRSVT